MKFYVHSKAFIPMGTQGESIKTLNRLRNEFIHFVPKGWSLDVSGLPHLFLDCFNIIEFLGWECNNIIWHDENAEGRAKQALFDAKLSLEL